MIRVPEAWSGPGQGQPLDAVAARGDTEVMEIVGTIDQWTPPEDVDALEALGATVVRYEGADHGFVHDPDRPVHRHDDAADAWSRVLAFLAG
jgi:carboxymethylenebutenolidase